MRIATFDIETTDLKALFGRILCASICEVLPNKKGYGKVETLRIDTSAQDLTDDEELCRQIRNELNYYHCIITWNGKLFDVPFLNARLAKAGHDLYKPQFHIDAMYYARGISLRIGSSKLVNVQKFFDVKSSKTDIDWDVWAKAAAHDKKALDIVCHHCELDVKVLAEVYWKILPLIANIHR